MNSIRLGHAAPVTLLALALAVAPGLAEVRWGGEIFRQPASWYGSSEAREAADAVLEYQSTHGGWQKNTDLLAPPNSGELEHPTIDNGATTTPMRFIALVASATGDSKYRESFVRGLDYLFEAQYPNGGWPQFYPLREGYYSRITFNDDAMANVLSLLGAVADGEAPYGFVGPERREKARAAVERGIDVILKTQIRQNGRLTGWCAQHDEVTLKPAWARAYEPPSLSGGETVDLVRVLMAVEDPSPEVVEAVEGAVDWLRSVAIHGIRVDRIRRDDGRNERIVVEDPDAPPVWARFYELVTDRPLFLDRDSVYRYDFSEIGYERRSGYSYHGDWAASLLEEDYPRWLERRGL